MALVDTNCDPDPITYVIACNDDALKSIKIILQSLTSAIIEKKNEMRVAHGKGDDEEGEERNDEQAMYAAKFSDSDDEKSSSKEEG
jgi:small subunit ribosomal protein S2